jgi:hypothetical protein
MASSFFFFTLKRLPFRYDKVTVFAVCLDKPTAPTTSWSWARLGTGLDDTVYALTIYDNKLIAGGSFHTAGGVSANHIAAWGLR